MNFGQLAAHGLRAPCASPNTERQDQVCQLNVMGLTREFLFHVLELIGHYIALCELELSRNVLHLRYGCGV